MELQQAPGTLEDVGGEHEEDHAGAPHDVWEAVELVCVLSVEEHPEACGCEAVVKDLAEVLRGGRHQCHIYTHEEWMGVYGWI